MIKKRRMIKMKINGYDIPDNLLYNKDYSWIKQEGDIATIGVIEPLAKKVKEFVFINLPEKGKKLKRDEEYLSLEAVKWSGHLSSPLTGEVIDVNQDLFDEPAKINNNPYKEWIMKIKISDKNELDNLSDANKISDWIKEKIK
jgi:glycine cleavage system H protein